MDIKDYTKIGVVDVKDASAASSGKEKHGLCRAMCRISGILWRILGLAREITANLLFLLFIILAVALYSLSSHLGELTSGLSPKGGVTVASAAKISKPSPVLWLDLKGYIDDQPLSSDPVSVFISEYDRGASGRFGIDEIEKALDLAATDDDVKVVVADVGDLTPASLEDIQRITIACDKFRNASQKPLIFFGRNFTQTQYLLSSHAGRIVLDPLGMVDLHGYATSSLYFKKALDEYNLTAYVFRRGSHKSAVEPLMSDKMSDGARSDYQALVDELMAQSQRTVASSRSAFKSKPILPDAQTYLKDLQKHNGDEAALALEYGLVDELMSRGDLIARLAKNYPLADNAKEPDTIGFYDYLDLQNSRQSIIKSSSALAMIAASGTITSDERDPRGFTTDNVLTMIDEAAADSKVKGILFRINSGGGEMGASEDIRRALEKYKKSGHKVVVYMEDMAASGAYMIASAADKIVASPWTITGSVGVFATAFGAQDLLNRHGINEDGVSTSPFAEQSVAAAIPDEQLKRYDLQIGHAYDTFVDMVAGSRSLKVSDAPVFAEGRVFTARKAKELGLIDEVGSIDDALRVLEKECGLAEDEAEVYDIAMPSDGGLGALRTLITRGAISLLPSDLALTFVKMISGVMPYDLAHSVRTFSDLSETKAYEKYAHSGYQWKPLILAQEPLSIIY